MPCVIMSSSSTSSVILTTTIAQHSAVWCSAAITILHLGKTTGRPSVMARSGNTRPRNILYLMILDYNDLDRRLQPNDPVKLGDVAEEFSCICFVQNLELEHLTLLAETAQIHQNDMV